MRAFGDFMKVKTHCCIGGIMVRDDERILAEGNVQVVVGTPGRVSALIERGILSNA